MQHPGPPYTWSLLNYRIPIQAPDRGDIHRATADPDGMMTKVKTPQIGFLHLSLEEIRDRMCHIHH